MKKNIFPIFPALLLSVMLFPACKKSGIVSIPAPHDITFEDQQLDTFTYNIPSGPFKTGDASSGIITVNTKNNKDGTYSGFALSNKNWRSYPWALSPDFGPASPTLEQQTASIDSTIYSVYTKYPNHTNNYLIACVKDDDANITLDKPAIVEHILVANNTYAFLLESYGSIYSGTMDPATQQYLITGTKVRNIQNPNTSTTAYGRFTLPGPGGNNLLSLAGAEVLAKRAAGTTAANASRLAGKTPAEVASDSAAAATALAKGYVKLTVNGVKGGTATGSVDFYLAVRPNVDPTTPTFNYIAGDWFDVDLTSLGTVDKLIFHLSSSYVDGSGNMLYPPYFCLDGMRIKQ